MRAAETPNPNPHRRWKRRIAKILAWTACLAVAAPIVAAAALLFLLNTGFGQRLAVDTTPTLTGGKVEISGLSGTLPWNIRIAHVALRDAAGTYATLETLHLAWSPLDLLSRTLHIEALTASSINLARLPQATHPSNQATPSALPTLPVRVVLDRLAIARLVLGKQVAGTAATLSVNGHADLASLSRGDATIAITRLDAQGTYSVAATMTPRTIDATLRADEPDQGLIAAIAHLPNLGGPLHLALSLAGPRADEALRAALAAGPLTAHASGTIDLPGRKAAIDLTAKAPAMRPAPGLSWRSVAIAAQIAGPWTRPEAHGTIAITALHAAGGAIGRLDATIRGNQGRVSLNATANNLVIPGPQPDLLAASPLHLAATALLNTSGRPVTFTLEHKLVAAQGWVDLGPTLHGRLHITLPHLAPFAAAAGLSVVGSTTLDIAFARTGTTTTASLSGPVAITGGMPRLAALIGRHGHLAVSAMLRETPAGPDIVLRSLKADGAALHLDAHGTDAASLLDLTYRLDLPDLAAASPALRGHLALQGTVRGKMAGGRADDLAAHLAATGRFGTADTPTGPLDLTVDASGLPSHSHATISLRATLDDAPLVLSAEATQGVAGTQFVLRALDWKTLHGTADLTLPAGATFPLGTLDLSMARLADLTPLLHQPLSGSLTAHVATAAAGGTPRVTLAIRAQNADIAAARVGSATLDGTIDDPIVHPTADLHLAARDVRVGRIAGQATITVTGPQNALAIGADATLAGLAGAPARIATRATVNVPASSIALEALTASWKGEHLRLLTPTRIAYAPQLSVAKLRLAIGTATLDLAGQVFPALDLTAHLANVTPELAKSFAPGLQADGVLDVAARLTGTAAAPHGTVRIAAHGMRLLSGDARAIPPADLLATLGLAGDRTHVTAHLTAGNSVALAITGTAPLNMTGKLDLAARGRVDLAIANPILEANGRHVAGQLAIDAALRGSASQPAMSGTIRLAGGELQDAALGTHLTDISALIVAQGQTVRIESFLAHDGPGTIRLSGSVGVLTPGIPVDLTLRMADAQPLASDLLTADLDADIALRGQAEHRLAATGTIEVRHATINIPNRFPSSVERLHVIRPGRPPPPPPGPGPLVALDLRVHAQPAIFVRGRGLFARLGGNLLVRGTSAAPLISEGFQMANGSFSLAGANLNLTEGNVTFDGAGITNKLDPKLRFVAQSSSGGFTANLTVGGTASQPTIQLSSSPTRPQDEILAHLLYGVSISQLSPFQIASIAHAVYSLTSGGGGGGPLAGVQRALGLDRLGIGNTDGTVGNASLQAGKYVAPGVYVGASASAGGATHAQVQINLTKRLKLKTTVGTGGGTVTGATPQDNPGSSVGLTYQFEY